jgi:hypothetical protein
LLFYEPDYRELGFRSNDGYLLPWQPPQIAHLQLFAVVVLTPADWTYPKERGIINITLMD